MSKEFFDAIKHGNLEEIQRLLSLTPGLIYENDNGLSPVMVAVYCQESEIADFLSDKTGSLNILEAAATGKTNQVARHLARDPFLVNTYTCDGLQPLGLACLFGHYETAEYLIKAGAQINTPSHNSHSAAPIQYAAAAGHEKIVILLLNNNANPNVRENKGYTPLHAAAEIGNTQIIRALLFGGADLTARNYSGKMPVDLAIEAGNAEAVALLKEEITRRFRASRVPV